MPIGSAVGVCQALHAGRIGIGLLGTGGTNVKAMTGYRRLMYSRRYHDGFKSLRQKHVKKNPGPQHAKSRNPAAGVNSSPGRWSLLVFLVGPGRHVQALKELAELTQVLLRLVARQFEVHTAERIRRGLQLYSAYSRLWGEEAARALLRNLRRTLIARGKHLLLSAVCVSSYDWESNKIPDSDMDSAVIDLDSVGELCKATIQCESCGKRQVIDQQMNYIDYCMCEGELGYTNTSRLYDSWEPFIERTNHIVWRKKHEVHQHLYAYKVYGTYDDVCLSAFMEVHLNSNFRTQWDDTALQLRILHSEKESNSDLLYWLVKYPHFFANRDYIYKRRFLWNEEKQEAIIMNEAVSLNDIPEEKGIHRVSEYWSVMVIRAKEDAGKPGLEYTLTYFDNPGTSLPQWLTNFIAVTGFPGFLQKVHDVAVDLQTIHEQGEDVYVSLPEELRYPSRPALEKPKFRQQSDYEIVPQEERIGIDAPEILEKSIESDGRLSRIVHPEHENSSTKLDNCQKSLIDDNQESMENRRLKDDLVAVNEELTTEVAQELESQQLGAETLPLDRTDTAQEVEKICLEENEADHDTEKNKIHDESRTDVEESDETVAPRQIDKTIRVQSGEKEVDVDILEGMEVTAPDLDKQTALSRNVEKLTVKAMEELEKRPLLLEQIEKLKHKLKLFQIYANQRKEISLRKMEELENRSHYEHTDDQTQKHLEKLFEAMRDVLQADIEMRTGKGLMSKISIHESKQSVGDFSQHTSFGMESNTASNESDDKIPSGDRLSDTSSSLPNRANGNERSKKKTKSSRDPPSPPPPEPPASTDMSDTTNGSRSDQETSSSEVETYSGVDYTKGDSQSSITNGWAKSLISLLYLAKWWESKESQGFVENIDAVKFALDSSEESDGMESGEGSVTSVVNQVWYVVGLGWLFQAKSEIPVGAQTVQEEACVTSYQNNSEKENYGWYWYPVSGAYRLYTWVFKSNVNA